MGALQSIFNKWAQGWKSISSSRKIAIIVLVSGIATALIFFITVLTKPKYEPLFTNMSTEDMAKVVEKLKQDKVSYKPDGTTLLVPRDKVEELRLSVASSGIMPSDGKGFELFDQSTLGMTDTDMRIMYQRALEGELQRTIKAFGEIEYARVHLVIPESSVFVRDKQLATASITLKLKNGIKLSPDQVRTIVALVSGSVPNLPKENVEVVDTSFNYLSQNMGDDNISAPSSAGSRYEMERQFEAGIESDLKDNLEAVFGANKVKVSVNADLDFDSKEITSIHYDKEGIVKSQNKIVETVSDGSNLSGSPVDNNSSNTIPSGGSTSGSTHQEETTNYNVGQIEEKTVKAPGEVKRITTSVVVDGNLSDSVKASINNIVAATTGYAEERGDLITVEGIPFDDTVKKQIEADLKEMEQLKKTEERNRKLVTYIGYPAIAVAGIIFLLILISKLKSQAGKRLDVVISEPAAAVVQTVKKPPIIVDEEEDKNDLTTELKNYASKRPDQVLEIVRSWLAEDER